MSRVRRGRESDLGSAAIEMLGVLPIVVLVVLVLLQVCAFTVTVQAANQAARDGARALSLGRPVATAVDRSLPGSLSARSISYPGGRAVRLEVDVPRVGIFPEMTVEREAEMP